MCTLRKSPLPPATATGRSTDISAARQAVFYRSDGLFKRGLSVFKTNRQEIEETEKWTFSTIINENIIADIFFTRYPIGSGFLKKILEGVQSTLNYQCDWGDLQKEHIGSVQHIMRCVHFGSHFTDVKPLHRRIKNHHTNIRKQATNRLLLPNGVRTPPASRVFRRGLYLCGTWVIIFA